MQSIGERLEEARKRKGISLREAAEATKIRSDFLGNIEQNVFDFDLPDIYKRGFIKNYARYLKLDPEKILTDYSALQLGNSRSKRGSSELFGKMEVKSSPKDSQPSSTAKQDSSGSSYGHIGSKQSSAPQGERYEAEDVEDEGSEENDKVFYMKAGLVCLGTLALVFVIFGLIRAILGGGSDAPMEEPELATDTPAAVSPANPTPTPTPGTSGPAVSSDSITLIASGTVYVVVQQQNDEQVLFRSTMAAGDTKQIAKSGPVNILFTAGENLTIEHSGERMRPSSSGTAKITIP